MHSRNDMNRDAYPNFHDATLAAQLDQALLIRAERAALYQDWAQIRLVLKFWREHGCPELTFRIVR